MNREEAIKTLLKKGFVVIRIGDKDRLVHRDVEMVIESHMAHIHMLAEENKGLRLLLGKAIAGEKITMKASEVNMFTWEKFDMESANEIKYGVERFIYDNWPELGACKCKCGKLADFESSRTSQSLTCGPCIGRK